MPRKKTSGEATVTPTKREAEEPETEAKKPKQNEDDTAQDTVPAKQEEPGKADTAKEELKEENAADVKQEVVVKQEDLADSFSEAGGHALGPTHLSICMPSTITYSNSGVHVCLWVLVNAE